MEAEKSHEKTKYIVDKYYVNIYKFIKYSLFVIITYLIVYFTLKEEENMVPYKAILTITTFVSILFYIIDANFPISNI
jgi:hypothetical protein